MLTHHSYPHLSLIELDDLRAPKENQSPVVCRYYEPLTTILQWAETFLCQPHSRLGREGAVCPYTRPSLAGHHFRLAIHQEQDISLSSAKEHILLYRDWLLSLEPTQPKSDAQYKTILLLFPSLTEDKAPAIIDTLQRELKPSFVEAGLMIGQFHPRCNEPGLWNANFRPLQTPLPLLAIRHMVPTDFPFLRHDPAFLAAYLRICENHIPQRLQSAVHQQQKMLALHPPDR